MTKALVLSAALLAAATATAADPRKEVPEDLAASVYRVRATRADKSKLELTGFKVKGEDGLYTSLHGVVGAEAIRVFQQSAEAGGYEMVVETADVARDTAYLVPRKKGATLPGGGLPLGSRNEKLTGLQDKEVKILGYPMGVNEVCSQMVLRVNDPAVTPLSARCPAKEGALLNERNSPNLDTPVLRVDGHLLPGHSGGAVMYDGRVVAIGNGGLREGQAGIGWAIPFHQIDLKPVADRAVAERLATLAKAKIDGQLFGILNDASRALTAKFTLTTADTVVGPKGDSVIGSQMKPKEAMDKYFELLKGGLGALGGKKEAPLEEAIKMFTENSVPLATGTRVEVKELDQDAPGKGPPAMPFPLVLPGGPGGNPLDGLKGALGTAAEGVNVKVKVLDGAQKGKELWVPRQFIVRQTTVAPAK